MPPSILSKGFVQRFNQKWYNHWWILEARCYQCNDILWWDEDESFNWIHENDNTPICQWLYKTHKSWEEVKNSRVIGRTSSGRQYLVP